MMVLKGRLYRIALSFSIAVFLLFQIGCALTEVQRKNTADFSTATAALAEMTSNELVRMRDGNIQMNIYRLAAVGEEEELAKLNDLDEAFNISDVKVRVQAVEVLETYGELLQALVEDTQKKELKKASDKFVESVKGLPSSEQSLSDAQADALGEIVFQIGRWFVEAKKAKAVKKIVNDSKPQIDYLCDLLSRDFDVDNERLLSNYKKSGDVSIARIRMSFLDSDDVLTRLKLVDMYKKTQSHRDRVDAIAKEMSKAIGDMKKANTVLHDSLQDREATSLDINEIKVYRNSVKEVVDAIKVLGD